MGTAKGTPLPGTALRPKGFNEIAKALEGIKPYQLVVYHYGRLSADRRPRSNQTARMIDAIANDAYTMAEENRVHLAQYKGDNGLNFYVATGKLAWGRLRS